MADALFTDTQQRVLSHPPFNVNKAGKDRLKDGKRFPFGMLRLDINRLKTISTQKLIRLSVL